MKFATCKWLTQINKKGGSGKGRIGIEVTNITDVENCQTDSIWPALDYHILYEWRGCHICSTAAQRICLESLCCLSCWTDDAQNTKYTGSS